ncbi:hypothetical protein H4I96_08571 [Botrytis cinerea]
MAILYLFKKAFAGTGPGREKSSGIQDVSSGYTFVSEISTDIFDASLCKIKPLRRLITTTHISTIIVPSSTLVIVPTITLIVPSTTKTLTPVTQPTVPPTGITAIALSKISSWNAIAATATDPIMKSILKSSISRESLAASLTPGAYTAVITISPAEQTFIDQENKEISQSLHTTTIILSCFFVGLFLACSYGFGSLGGLMAEMGRENIVGPEGHENRADGIHRVPRVPRVHSTLQELAIPEGVAELPGSVPEMQQLRHTGLKSEGEVVANTQKALYEV